MKAFYIVGHDAMVSRLMRSRGYLQMDDASLAELVIFTGGEDVNPELYGDVPHPRTFFSIFRDEEELSIYRGLEDHQLKAGICRGGQFLNVMSGGAMWQDVDKHAIWGTHPVKYYDGKGGQKLVECTSTHHQMMRPKGNYELWGTAALTTFRDTGRTLKYPTMTGVDGEDVEIVYYPDTHSLCFQPHPEYGVRTCADLWFECLDRAFASENKQKEAA